MAVGPRELRRPVHPRRQRTSGLRSRTGATFTTASTHREPAEGRSHRAPPTIPPPVAATDPVRRDTPLLDMPNLLSQPKGSEMTTDPSPGSTHLRAPRSGVAIVLAGGLLIVASFQAALTLGAPFGAAAMGGTNVGRLPDPLRIFTGIAAITWLFASQVVLARGGKPVLRLPRSIVQTGTWILVVLLGAGAVMNFASSSSWERFGWGPFTLTQCVLCLVLAKTRPTSSGQKGRST